MGARAGAANSSPNSKRIAYSSGSTIKACCRKQVLCTEVFTNRMNNIVVPGIYLVKRRREGTFPKDSRDEDWGSSLLGERCVHIKLRDTAADVQRFRAFPNQVLQDDHSSEGAPEVLGFGYVPAVMLLRLRVLSTYRVRYNRNTLEDASRMSPPTASAIDESRC